MKTNRIFFWMLGCVAVLSALQGLQAQTPGLSYPVPLDEAHFPDEVFREYLMGRYINGDNIDKNGDGQLSVEECGDVTAVGLKIENGLTYVTLTGVSSLKGIEYFYALDSLGFYDGSVTSLDVSKNTALTALYCYDNQLTSLDVSKNTALTVLFCYGNQLTSLDLSWNTALTNLDCGSNQLTSLDVSKNTALTALFCYGNQLTSLDVSKNTALTDLNCSNNQLTSLDVSKNTALTYLYCNYNNLAALDLSRNSSLWIVDAVNNYYEVSLDEDGNVDIAAIPGLEADRMTDLQGGHIEGNTLHLDAEVLMYYYDYKCPSPYAYPSGGYFYIATDNPAYCIPIDKEHFPDTAFRSFVAAYIDRNEDGQLSSGERSITTGIDVSNCGVHDLRGIEYLTGLQILYCYNNDLTSLDVSKNTALTVLFCYGNQLTSLDVSKNTALTDLNCSNNQLTSLDVSKNTALTYLYCNYNNLAALDLSRNSSLWIVDAVNNYYEVSLDEDGNVDIAAIPGLEADRMTDLQGGHIEGNTLHLDAEVLMYYYDYKCPSPYAYPSGGYFYIATDNPAYCIPIDKEHFPDTAFRSFVAAYIDRNEDGQLSSGEIGIVTGINVSYQGIRDLRGIEHFTFLQSLDCSSNQLTSLDVSGCTALTVLYCYGNQLTHLDVSGCTALWTLDCSNNALLDLDVRSLSALQELDCSKNQLASLDLFRNANLVSVKADSNYREVIVNQDRQFDISTLPRFERARMEAIEGGTLQGDILTFEQDEVRYFYSYNNADPNLPLGEYFHLKAVQAPVPGIAINDTTFPDAVFRGYIAENADTDKDGLLSESEIAGVTGLDVSGMGIRDLRGIGYFTALESLDCSDNALTSLDLSANTALQTLNAGGNRLDIVLDEDNAFDVSSLPGFDMAKASDWTGCTRTGNRLTFTQQEVTYNYATGYSGSAEDASLKSVTFSLFADRDPSVAPEKIVTLDEAHFPDSVFRQYITAADLDADHWLDEDEIAGVTGLDVSGMGIQDLRGIGYFTALESLDCSDNALTSLDLSANTALQMLNASGNRLDIVLDESNAFDVSSLPGFNMAKASDWTGCTRMGNKLTFTQQEVTYAYATGYSGSAEDASLKSVTFSLFADRDPSMGNETSDLQPQGRVYAKDRTLYTEGISGEVSVFTAVGTLVYQGKDTRIPVRKAGTYLVRHGSQVWKILVM